jgi:UDP-N-acetylglucosamine--N-acetylmuramyl-(pentapeptide) pyrophosphoryl-undecaprenol N-acetylglucosamine transferase
VTQARTPKVLIMAAGTGGHIYPGLAIAKELELRGWNVHWMGTPWGMENKIVADAGYPMVNINIGGVRGKGIAAWLFLPLRILVGFVQSTVAILRIRPDVVLSLGGYVAFPGGMMAVLWGRPLVVHEPGAVAGITNRLLAAVADRVIVGMEGAFESRISTAWANRIPKPSRVEWLGTPVREDIEKVPAPEETHQEDHGRFRRRRQECRGRSTKDNG